MDLKTRLMIDNVLIVVGILGFAIAVVGEVLGWWNDLGTILAFASLALAALAVLDRSGARLVEWTRHQDAASTRLVRGQTAMLGNQGSMLRNQHGMLQNQEAMLRNQEVANRSLERIVRILDERLPGSD